MIYLYHRESTLEYVNHEMVLVYETYMHKLNTFDSLVLSLEIMDCLLLPRELFDYLNVQGSIA